jgi:hypothetical protein
LQRPARDRLQDSSAIDEVLTVVRPSPFNASPEDGLKSRGAAWFSSWPLPSGTKVLRTKFLATFASNFEIRTVCHRGKICAIRLRLIAEAN